MVVFLGLPYLTDLVLNGNNLGGEVSSDAQDCLILTMHFIALLPQIPNLGAFSNLR
jgi:hypothetical protein